LKGSYGKMLRVNLTEHKYTVSEIPEEVFFKFLGGKGLGTYLLLKNVPPGTEPLSKENRLIFTTGFAAGTKMFGSSRYGVFTKSPLTGLYSESYSGGGVAPALHATGYDAVILEGKSDKPVYLEITENGAVFHQAEHLWGMETYQTEDIILSELNNKSAQVLTIGPAGENLVRFACIENNYWRSAGRTGVGAVMGSKKVKAIAFHGKKTIEPADPERLQNLMKKIAAGAKDNPGVKAYQKYGTTQMVAIMNGARAFPNRYWSEAYKEQWENISGERLHQDFQVKPSSCPKCLLTCGNLTTVTKGKYKNLTLEGPEYETIYAFGGLCAINSLEEIIYLNDLCDRLGMDTISAGNLIAMAMETQQRGRFDTGIRYGDTEGTAQLLQEIAAVKNRGQVLSQGIRYAAKKWGMEDAAVHVKGLEPPGYDPRPLKGMGLAYATSTRGACHLRATFYKPELVGIIDPKTIQGKAELFIDYENRLTIFNTGILCVFYRDLILWEDLVELVAVITGLNTDKEHLEETANRIITASRIFNAREYATKSEDTLPERLFKESVNEGNDCITSKELNYMVDEYYNLRGWDENGFSYSLKDI